MALQAGASGVAFTPVPGLLGSDLLRVRTDFKVVDDPYRPGQRVVLVPAITPDFALVQAHRADQEGNVVLSTRRDDRLLIQAARNVIVAVGEVSPGATRSLMADEQLVPAAYIDALVLAQPGGGEEDEIRTYLEQLAARIQP
jgi:glutaconate CoA-transferase subunit A